MANYYSNLLTIMGPNIKGVLALVKADAPNVDEHGQTHELYFDPQRIAGSRKHDCMRYVCLDHQEIWGEDGSAVIRFDTVAYPAFYLILWLSEMFRANTFKLRWWFQPGGNPNIVLFRDGEASHAC